MVIFVLKFTDMKRIVFSFLFLFSIASIISCDIANTSATEAEVVKTEQKEVLAENKEAVDMKVEGMVCAMGCAKYIEDKVAAIDGVSLSTVDFEKGVAHFEFDKTVTSPKDLENFIVSIHDGQYSAKIISEKELEEIEKQEVEESVSKETNSDEEVASVSTRFQFSIPDLLNALLQGIR